MRNSSGRRAALVAAIGLLTGGGAVTEAAAAPAGAAVGPAPVATEHRTLIGNMRLPVERFSPARGTAVSDPTAATGLAAPHGLRAVPLGTGLQTFTIKTHTQTAYTTSDEGTVSVVDVGHCNIEDSGSCSGSVADLPGLPGGVGAAVYRNTLYVTSGTDGTDGAVSVYDISHCRAGDTTGCGAAVATLPIADVPLGVALDRATGTLYVGNVADHVDVLALASCRQQDVSGCGSADVASIPAKNGPAFPTLDAGASTLYVPANGPGADGSGNSVDVVDLRHCDASDTSGCSAAEASMRAGVGAVIALLDRRTGTLYVQNQTEATVSVLDVRHCSATVHSGCRQHPAGVPVGSNPSGGMVEIHHQRLYVADSDSDTLSVFGTVHCRAGHTTGCSTSPVPTARAGGAPFWLIYDRATATIFSVDHADKAMSAIAPDICSGDAGGCRHLLPSIGGNEQQVAVPAVHTWYGVDGKGDLTLADTRTCNAAHARRCSAAAIHTSRPNTTFGQIVADPGTHSLYLLQNNLKSYRGFVAVVDLRTCNAHDHSDCRPVARPMRLPDYTAQMSIDRSTHTVYVVTQFDSSLQVVDGTTCNAMRQSGCSGPAGEVPLDGVAYGIAVDPSTRTVYVSEFGQDFDSDVVYAVDSSHCRAGDVSGCGHTPKQFTSGLAPLGMVVDHAHHSLYVLANAGGDAEGELDVFDTRTCSARGVDGCTPAAAFDVGRAPFVAAFDPRTHHLFLADFEHAAVSVIDTKRCNASATQGCHDRQLDVGDSPGRVAVDPSTHSLFVLGALYNRSYYLDTRLR